VNTRYTLPIMSAGSPDGRMRRKLSFPLIPAVLAVVVVAAAVAALFVPTMVSFLLVGIAIVLVALGAFTLARQL
jgi:uncharacterized membrane protein YdbT with pleckstrin-like domain